MVMPPPGFRALQRRNNMSDTETGSGDFTPQPLADILSREEPTRDEPTGGQPDPVPAPEAPAETGEPPAAPPAAEIEPAHVPLTALKDERTKRQALETEMAELRARLASVEKQPPAQEARPLPDPVADPAGYRAAIADAAFNERLNVSEMMAREKYTDVDAKLAVFQEAAKADPGLADKLRAQPHPWAWMYQQAQKIEAQREIGDDPAAYRERVRAEIMAEMQGKPPAAPVLEATPLPTSLATTRSVGRTASEPNGPMPLDKIVRFKG